MQDKLKESKIGSWWIAPRSHELRFINILSEEDLKGDLIVVGYMKGRRHTRELWTSSNRVLKITEDGVITAQGSFYPFEEAHPIYLRFLVQANKPSTKFAYQWGHVNKSDNKQIIANVVMANGKTCQNITFDIIPDKRSPVLVSGYSEKLGGNVVFASFDKRGFCIRIGISEDMKEEIYCTSLVMPKELSARAQQVREIFKSKMEEECIYVIR